PQPHVAGVRLHTDVARCTEGAYRSARSRWASGEGRRHDTRWIRGEHRVHGERAASEDHRCGGPPALAHEPNDRRPPHGEGDRLGVVLRWLGRRDRWEARSHFRVHHQPFAYFASYGDGTDGRRQHLKDERDFMTALRDRTLPAVSFVKPLGADSGHPKYGDVRRGEDHVAALVKAVQESDYWKDTVIVLTYDENGGFWDHVAPPTIDRWGPGTRVPTIVVSPFAKTGHVDHTRYDTTSILRLIELRRSLDPLG